MATSTASAGPKRPETHQIDISQLSLPQLNSLKQQFEQDINVFQELWQALKVAHGKFIESAEAMEKFKPGKDILVPLTGSMYIPGAIPNIDKVLIDIGAGYYAQKTITEAKDYFKRKIEYVTEQMDNIQAMGIEKTKVRDAVVMMMEMKVQAAAMAQKPTSS